MNAEATSIFSRPQIWQRCFRFNKSKAKNSVLHENEFLCKGYHQVTEDGRKWQKVFANHLRYLLPEYKEL